MKIGVIGAFGRVGKLLVGMGAIPLECDITDAGEIEEAITRVKPDVIASLASKSDVDWGEKDENLTSLLDVNMYGVHNLGATTFKLNIPAVIISTDHIFSGKNYFDLKLKYWIKSGPYKENYARPIPVNRYGMSKLAAETLASSYDNIKVIRTSYLFDADRLTQINTNEITDGLPTFIVRSFMYVQHFANSLWAYLNRISDMPEILHLSGSHIANWHDFVKKYREIFGYDFIELKKRKKEILKFAPRPHRAGLKVELSKKLNFMQYSYVDGLLQMKSDMQIHYDE